MKLTEKIGRRYRDMTENEKRIFRLMMEDVKSFSLKSIGELAKQLDISKTTLMRFAKSNGFSGYSDFKKALQEEEILDLYPAEKMKKVMTGDCEISAESIFSEIPGGLCTENGDIQRGEAGIRGDARRQDHRDNDKRCGLGRLTVISLLDSLQLEVVGSPYIVFVIKLFDALGGEKGDHLDILGCMILISHF